MSVRAVDVVGGGTARRSVAHARQERGVRRNRCGSHDDSRFRTSEAQELTVACTAAAKVGDDVDRVMASRT